MLLFALLAADTSWKDFSDWFSKEGTPGPPADVVKAYAAKLKARAVADEEIQTRIKEVQEYLIFTWAEAPFSREPSTPVKKVVATRKPGKALDIAMGQGRNSIWLAKAGWTVSGYDISDEALRQANAAAAETGVKLDTRLASHDEYDLGRSQWDLIVMSFAFTKLNDRPT